MKKRSIIFLLILTLVLSVGLAGCSSDEEPVDTSTEEVPEETEEVEEDEVSGPPSEPTGQVTIGDTTELTGDWVPYWTNNAADYNVYNFISGYSTVAMTFDGEYIVNETVVKEYDVVENEDGSKTHTWTINDGLTYSDGSPITAADYVTSVAFRSSPQVQGAGGVLLGANRLKGYNEFSKGEVKEFAGVNLIDEMTFSTTVAADELPYFYELNAASAYPEKLSFWTDDSVTIQDDGNGVYFSDNFTQEAFEERFNEARYAVEDFPATGAYVLKSYDESQKVAVMEVNENYIGDFEGNKPLIQTVIYKRVTNETALDELETGGVDLLTDMMSGDEVNAGLDLVDKGGFDFVNYPRAGYGKITFQVDFGPTQFLEVRQAIAHLLDRNEFAKTFTGGFGSVVDGPYGESMWFYKETQAELNEKLNPYTYSLERAVELLEEGGWVYDADGNDYTEGIRHKKMDDGTFMPLEIEWASSEQNAVSDLLVVQLQENEDLAAAGMKINQTVMTFGDLLNYLYRDGTVDPKYRTPTYGMYNLATGFTPVYDLSRTYTTDMDLINLGGINDNYIVDEELEAAAKAMVQLAPEQKEEFKEEFVKFVSRWNELLPDLPLYSNIIHDFFNDKLQNYDNNPLVRINQALLNAYVTE